MNVKMIAAMTFRGQEGFIITGQIFEANNSRRAEELVAHKLANVYEDEGIVIEEEGIDIEEILKGLNSHAKVDDFAKDHNLVIPSKDEAKLDDRKAAIVEALENGSK